MRILTVREFWTGVLFIVAGAAFLYMASGNRLGSAADMGPAYFPSLVAILLIVVGLISCALALRPSPDEVLSFDGLRSLVIVVLATAAFGYTVERLGLLAATCILVGISSFAGPRPRALEVVLLAILLSAVGAALFVFGLGVSLPLLPTIFSGATP